ncbi:hypothetical protein [Cryptosporangium arvum]|uniref:hypothetical protein n=1 Tax=Cryptosporangium arvum TaxID=80871 RepID=UPI0005671918|nr:hypothetical protein [Cryptosporangium arvum]
MSPSGQTIALASINRSLVEGRPCVATCTEDAYRALSAAAPGELLSRSTALELQPLDAHEVIDYVRRNGGRSDIRRRWRSEHSDGLADVVGHITTPLMAAMLREACLRNDPSLERLRAATAEGRDTAPRGRMPPGSAGGKWWPSFLGCLSRWRSAHW